MIVSISYPPVKLPGSRQDGMTYDFDSQGEGLAVSLTSSGRVRMRLASSDGKILDLDLAQQDAKTMAYLLLQGADGDCTLDGTIS